MADNQLRVDLKKRLATSEALVTKLRERLKESKRRREELEALVEELRTAECVECIQAPARCKLCKGYFCVDCKPTVCLGCEGDVCLNCIQRCVVSDEWYCKKCIEACTECGQPVCPSCRCECEPDPYGYGSG